MDPERLARLFEFALKIYECLSKMQPTSRARLLALVERLSGVAGVAEDVEQLVGK